MKIKLVGIAIIICFSVNSYAQDNVTLLHSKTVEQLQFTPTEFHLSHFEVALKPIGVTTNKFLYSTGWFLQGLKFKSPIDRFHSYSPFDIRGYQTKTVQEYQFLLHRNQFLPTRKNDL